MSGTDSRYRETLHTWAQKYVPDDAKVTKVEISYDDGFDPTYTNRPESLAVTIMFEDTWEPRGRRFLDQAEVLSDLGTMLTELFAIEETP